MYCYGTSSRFYVQSINSQRNKNRLKKNTSFKMTVME